MKDNTYIDICKKGDRKLRNKKERELYLVCHAGLYVYCSEYSEQHVIDRGLKYNQFINTYACLELCPLKKHEAKQ